MENSKVKALFFAQYFKVPVYCNNYLQGMNKLLPVGDYDNLNHDVTDSYLLLRTVDQLTDEELLIIARLLKPREESTNKQAIIYAAYQMRTKFDSTRPFNIYSALHQVLIGFGILIPFTYIDENGKPQTLQPDEIIKLGWAKVNHLDK